MEWVVCYRDRHGFERVAGGFTEAGAYRFAETLHDNADAWVCPKRELSEAGLARLNAA